MHYKLHRFLYLQFLQFVHAQAKASHRHYVWAQTLAEFVFAYVRMKNLKMLNIKYKEL